MNTDGTGTRLLTTGPDGAHEPALRTDGALAYVYEETATGPHIRWRLPGSEVAHGLRAGRDPAWSPTGDRLTFAGGVYGVSQVFVAQGTDWSATAVTAEAAYAGQPAWSPNGTRLAYAAEREMLPG
jgi:Tol biopolymer transport system component